MTRPTVVFVGSHLGYPMDRTPLGGGAMVGAQLARHWARRPAGWPSFELLALGSGPQPPAPGLPYARLPEGDSEGRQGIVSLSELRYARFCRQFERATTDWILARRHELPPSSTSILVNDISEGPDLARLAAAGYPIVTIWHVDVLDYFAKMYFKGAASCRSLARGHEKLSRLRLSGLLPDVLKLVFEKQRETVRWSNAMIFPSRGMVDTVLSCYGDSLAPREDLERRCRVIPWGAWRDDWTEKEVASMAQEARRRYGIGPATRVITTVSRISPEKGLHHLLEAVSLVENDPKLADLCVLVCGEPAFMQGAAYMRRVKEAAGRLRKARVFFPGYLAPAQKQAHFRVSHLFVSPSVHESYGLSIAEALRAGLPVLASDHYGVRELLKPDYGRVVPYGSSPRGALAGALRELLSGPAELAEMGKRAGLAGEKMSFENAAQRVFETALQTLPQPAGSRA